VVIAIIALLMSILIPTLRKIRQQAQTMVCQSNLRNFGFCMQAYASDYGGKICSTQTQILKAGLQLWTDSLMIYHGGEEDLRVCPAAKLLPEQCVFGSEEGGEEGVEYYGSRNRAWAWERLEEYGGSKTGSYGMNGFAQDWDNNPWGYSEEEFRIYFWTTIRSKNPDAIPLIIDMLWREAYVLSSDLPADHELAFELEEGESQIQRMLLTRHGKAVNMVLMAGHVEKVPLEEMWKFRWSKIFEPQEEVEIPWLD
jgi:hypothetical protein